MPNSIAYQKVRLKAESIAIEGAGGAESFKTIKTIATFLKANKLSLVYTKGTTSALLHNYKMGLSRINPPSAEILAQICGLALGVAYLCGL